MAIKMLKVPKNKNIFDNEEINKKYSKVSGAINNTPGTIQQNIFKTAPTANKSTSSSKIVPKSTSSTPTESVSDILRANYPTVNVSSSSGGGAGMIDISEMLKAYEQSADSNRKVAEQTYNTRRNDLITSLKRFQEQNAKDVEAQRKTYLSNQALLESAIAEADRNNRINAAARGLGGSGLQQLSQLQTLLSQGQTISDMATENQDVVNNLREVLANYEEDINTAKDDALTTYNNAISTINSDLATNKANLEYQAREAAANRAQAEAATAAQIAAQNAQYDAQAKQDERMFNSQISTLQKNYENEISNIDNMSASTLKDLYGTKKASEAKKTVYNNYYSSLGSILDNYGMGGTGTAQSQYNTLSSLYNKYSTPVASTSSKSNTSSFLGIPIRTLSSKETSTYNDLYNKYLKQTNSAYKARQLANEEFTRLQ